MANDILETRVKSCKDFSGGTSLTLSSEGYKNILFTLPILLQLQPEDRLQFVDSTITQNLNREDMIEHKHYHSVMVITAERPTVPVAYLSGTDMQTLADIKSRYRHY